VEISQNIRKYEWYANTRQRIAGVRRKNPGASRGISKSPTQSLAKTKSCLHVFSGYFIQLSRLMVMGRKENVIQGLMIESLWLRKLKYKTFFLVTSAATEAAATVFSATIAVFSEICK
jgi:hypothetical protein